MVEGTQIGIEGNWKGATRLREWVFGTKARSRKGYVEEGDTLLFEKIAVTHANLILTDQPFEQILAVAATAAERKILRHGFQAY